MSGLNFVDMRELKPKTKLFRYLSLRYFLQMIEKRYNALAHISKWDDPYEAFIFREKLDMRDANSPLIYDTYKHYYGQSWTLHEKESDLRWRAYCKRGEGVRISTTVTKLAESLSFIQPTGLLDCACRIARVNYGVITKDKKGGKSTSLGTTKTKDHLAMFFLKREEFSEEEEVRLMFSDEQYRSVVEAKRIIDERGDLKWEDGMLKYEVDPKGLIEEVLVDPMVTLGRYEELVCRCVNAGFPAQRIKHSTLFERPSTEVTKTEGLRSSMLKRREFWQMLQERYPTGGALRLTDRSVPYDSYWSGLPVGVTGLCFSFVSNRKDTRVELYIGTFDAQKNQNILERLSAQNSNLENHLKARGCSNFRIEFQHFHGKKAARVSVRYGGIEKNVKGETDHNKIIDWFCNVMPPFAEFMKEAVSKVIQKLPTERKD